VARTVGHLDVFWIDRDGAVVSKWWDQAANADWREPPFRVTGRSAAAPGAFAAVSVEPSRTDLVFSDGSAPPRFMATWWHDGTNGGAFNAAAPV